MTSPVVAVELANYPLLRRGKVRDVFDLGEHLLLVASDRISAFDVVLPSVLSGKGIILTGISQLWFEAINSLIPTQMTDLELTDLKLSGAERDMLEGRSVIARKANRIDIECVVRAYLSGSAWKEYQQRGTVAGIAMPEGMHRGDRFPELHFTPAIKNDSGHDENISFKQLVDAVGGDLSRDLERLSRALFELGSKTAAKAGFALADTKFEFGWIDGNIAVIDEVLTPDSSRYWDSSEMRPGEEPAAYDKQIIRDWLESTGWNKQWPGPELPSDIVDKTLERYRSVSDRLHSAMDKGG